MPQILIDTNILIDISRGYEPTIQMFDQAKTAFKLSVSVVTYMELIVGCKNKQSLRAVESFLNDFQIIMINADTTSRALEMLKDYRLSHGLLLADALIAATAIENGLSLLTRNRKDFQFIDGLSLVPTD